MRRRVKREVKKLRWKDFGVAKWADFREEHEEIWAQLDGTEDKKGNKMEITPEDKMDILMDKLEDSQIGLEESEQTWAHAFDSALEGHELADKPFGFQEMCNLIKTRCEGAAMREKEAGKSTFGAVAWQSGDSENCEFCCEPGHTKEDCPLRKSGGKPVCRGWYKNGHCSRGSKCRFDHPPKHGRYAKAEKQGHQHQKPQQQQQNQQQQQPKAEEQKGPADPSAARRFLLSLSEEQAGMFVGMHCHGDNTQMAGIAVDGDITDLIYGDTSEVCGP